MKVLDFGLAKLAPEGPDGGPSGGGGLSQAPTGMTPLERPLTDAGMVVGTVPYMSPEQVGGETVDTRSDIFSLGIVLYEMATGRRPFQGKNKAETISSILRDAPRPVSEARRDAPRHLGRIIDHCLQKEPRERFQTARDVYNELRALRREVESETSAVTSRTSLQADAVFPVSAPPREDIRGTASASGSGPARVLTASGAPTSGATAGSTLARPWIWAAGGGVLVLAIGVAFWLGGRRGPDSGTAGTTRSAPGTGGGVAVAETNSLAVLPFTNMSPDKDQEYFSDGLTEELLNALVKIPDLKVAGRTSSFSFKGKNEDLRTIAEKLGVANILGGSVRKSGNRVRITAQLVKAADGFHLWSETYDRTLDDIFAVQDDIARAVAKALEVTLLGQPANTRHPDAGAYDLVLQARYVLQTNTPERVAQAKEMLERALSLSPDYAPAWSEMGLAHVRDLERSSKLEETQRALQRAREALGRALQLDPNLALAHSRMASVQQSAWEFSESERSAARALAADPKNPLILGNAAIVYSNLGRITDAIRLGEQVLRSDPLTPTNFLNVAGFYSAAGRLDDAEPLFRKAIALRPDNPMFHYQMGLWQLLRGRAGEARASFERFDDLAKLGDYGRLPYEAMIGHTAGNEAASKAAADEFEKQFGAEDPSSCAQIRAWRGEPDRAFAWYEKAVAARDPILATIKTDPTLNSLHSDPRWNALLKKIGLPTD